jgi:uncharacterized protein YabN with tetrapyrrole methylase and pyrophosphatase domain
MFTDIHKKDPVGFPGSIQNSPPPGSLIVVGTGIKSISQITLEALSYIRDAQKLLYLSADPITVQYLQQLNSSAENLHVHYQNNKPREETYLDMRSVILGYVRSGLSVCVALYGHPGVFATPAHQAIALAKSEGYEAFMTPGISAEDCLFADLGIDPATYGCQSFEATDFLLFTRKFDPFCSLILWQIGVIGHFDYQETGFDTSNIKVLMNHLLKFYPANHKVILYEASTHVLFSPRIQTIELRELNGQTISTITTLYVPPIGQKKADCKMLCDLKVEKRYIKKNR